MDVINYHSFCYQIGKIHVDLLTAAIGRVCSSTFIKWKAKETVRRV